MGRAVLHSLAICVWAVGCFSPGAPATADAPTSSAADAEEPATTATVTVYSQQSWGQVVVDCPVLVYDSQRQLVSRTTTDTLGRATFEVPAGGSVTTVAENTYFTTFVGVEAGDRLTAGTYTSQAQDRNSTVRVPPGPNGTTRYTISGRCAYGSSEATSIPVREIGGCGIGPRAILASTTGNQGRPTHFLFAPQVELTEGGTLPLTGPWNAAVPFPVTVGGLEPSDFYSWVGIRSADRLVWSGQATMPGPNTLRTGSIPFPAVGDGTYLEYRQYAPSIAAPVQIRSVEETFGRLLTSARSDNFLEHPYLVDEPTQAALTESGIRWMSVPRSVRPVVIFTQLTSVTSEGQLLSQWTILLPPGATEFVYPPLPPDLAATWVRDRLSGEVIQIAHSHLTPRQARQYVYAGFGNFGDAPAPRWRSMSRSLTPRLP